MLNIGYSFILVFILISDRCDLSLEKSLEQCLLSQDSMSLYRLALNMMLNSLSTDTERHVMKEVTLAQDHPYWS